MVAADPIPTRPRTPATTRMVLPAPRAGGAVVMLAGGGVAMPPEIGEPGYEPLAGGCGRLRGVSAAEPVLAGPDAPATAVHAGPAGLSARWSADQNAPIVAQRSAGSIARARANVPSTAS